jgi:NodT family efflux transporter outer membrane factor (OMF) lipoprotein
MCVVLRFSFITAIIIILSGCQSLGLSQQSYLDLDIPENWHSDIETTDQDDWFSEFKSQQLTELLAQALKNNQSLQQKKLQVSIARENLTVARSILFPRLDLSASTSRSKNNQPVSYSNAASASLTATYEVDIWGKLDDQVQNSIYSYQQSVFDYEDAKQQLIADVTSAWVDVITNYQVIALFERRVELAEQTLSIIESGYKQGLNEALDVYLTRNELNSERSRLSEQLANTKQAERSLERLLGEYPAGKLFVSDKFFEVTRALEIKVSDIGLPSELITRKPELQAAWQALLAANSELAFAHKQRFPSLSLTAQIGDSGEKLSDLFSTSTLAWSLLGSLTAPVFNAGELKAKENIAEFTVQQVEQSYLDTLYDSFESVENALTQEVALMEQFKATQAAKQNAEIAQVLSFEQYQKGLVSYTTVLDAQNRAYDAQNNLILIQNQRLKNRISLYLALGGDPRTDKS